MHRSSLPYAVPYRPKTCQEDLQEVTLTFVYTLLYIGCRVVERNNVSKMNLAALANVNFDEWNTVVLSWTGLLIYNI